VMSANPPVHLGIWIVLWGLFNEAPVSVVLAGHRQLGVFSSTRILPDCFDLNGKVSFPLALH
jgi:hypothetical protein